MNVAVRIEAGADAELAELQRRYHLAAGADHVVSSFENVDDADWVIDARPGEFWWPRAESLKEVLAPIPPRYTIVQALVREFDSGRATQRATVDGMKAAGRPLLRAARRRDAATRTVPLRAWYPLEVLAVSHDVSPGKRVDDPRLADALQRLRGGGDLTFRSPDIVDDAAYAVECAAVGEVDLPRLEAYVSELEQRISLLERRLWPRILRTASRVARRR
jgi:hypothetical protein